MDDVSGYKINAPGGSWIGSYQTPLELLEKYVNGGLWLPYSDMFEDKTPLLNCNAWGFTYLGRRRRLRPKELVNRYEELIQEVVDDLNRQNAE
jgi:hypothetical protein